MFELVSHQIKDFAYFKDATFQYKNGVQYVLGRNLNAKSSKASNGSGKSSLFTPFHYAIGLPSPVAGVKSGTKSTLSPNSVLSLTFKRNGVPHTVSRFKGGIQVIKDGKEKDLRTVTLAQEYVSSLLPLSEEEVFSSVFIDSSRPHVLVSGTPSQRLAFMTGLFRLDNIDETRRLIKRRMSKLVTDEALLVRAQDDLKEAGQKFDLASLESERDALSSKVEKLRAKTLSLDDFILKTSLYLEFKPTLDRVHALQERLSGSSRQKVRRQLDNALELRSDWSAYRKSKEALNASKRELASILEQISLEESDLHQAMEDYYEVSSKAKDVQPPIYREEYDSVADIDKDALLDKVSARSAELSALQHKLKSALEDHVEECPSCGTPLSKDHVESHRSTLQAAADKAAAAVLKLKGIMSLVLSYEAYSKKLEEYRVATSFVKKKARMEERYGAKMSLVSSALRLSSLIKTHLSKPESPEPIPDAIEALEKELSRFDKLATLKSSLPKVPLESDSAYTEEDLATAKASKESVSSKLSSALTALQKCSSDLQLGTTSNARIDSLTKQIHSLSEALADKVPLETLFRAFSNGVDGLKSHILSSLCRELERNMNRYSPMLFRERFEFNLILGPTGISLLVNRNPGKGQVTSDVVFMSGAERRVCSWLLLLSILPMIPSSRRFDTVVMDEPDANLDEPMISIFRDRFLNQLKSVVKKIVVISPREDVVQSGARINRVTKQGRWSTLSVEVA